MHTTDLIRTSDFAFELDGQPVSFEQIFPGFHAADRVGIVVRDSGGSIGASGLLAASIAKFYDFYREHLGNGPDKLRIYPDYYVFHVGIRHLDHYWMDIWPPHKEVVVGDEPELVLEAINDRGITRLLVQDAVPYQAAALYELSRKSPSILNVPCSYRKPSAVRRSGFLPLLPILHRVGRETGIFG